MRFVIHFVGEGDSAIALPCRRVGLAALSEARRVSGVPGLTPELVDDYISSVYENPKVVITEEEARESGRFADDCQITVKVPGRFLNHFVGITPDIQRDDNCGAVTSVKFRYTLNEGEVVRSWMKAGAPLEWEIDEEDVWR